MVNFNEIDLSQKLIKSLQKINYETLTSIQEKVIPNILENKDVMACSRTGSGKTGAFLIPIISKIYSDFKGNAIVVVPTRELAVQILNSVKEFTDNDKGLQTALLIGGAKTEPQLRDLRKKPRIVIGTPGRINDHIRGQKLDLKNFNILVLDEMDRMLDMGFSVQIDEILETMPEGRQTLLFSATASKKIEEITKKYLNNPVIIKTDETNQPSKNVEQRIIEVKNSEKFNKLLDIIKGSNNYYLVFAGTQNSTVNIADKLSEYGFETKAIHGGMKQRKRDSVIKSFGNKKFNILVATDVAARGLDIHHIDYVINYDMPRCPEDYIHRIGRASRSDSEKGISISFMTSGDKAIWKAVKGLINNGEYEELSFEKKGGNMEYNRKSRGDSSFKRKSTKSFDKRDNTKSDKFSKDREYKNRPKNSEKDGEFYSYKDKGYEKNFDDKDKRERFSSEDKKYSRYEKNNFSERKRDFIKKDFKFDNDKRFNRDKNSFEEDIRIKKLKKGMEKVGRFYKDEKKEFSERGNFNKDRRFNKDDNSSFSGRNKFAKNGDFRKDDRSKTKFAGNERFSERKEIFDEDIVKSGYKSVVSKGKKLFKEEDFAKGRKKRPFGGFKKKIRDKTSKSLKSVKKPSKKRKVAARKRK